MTEIQRDRMEEVREEAKRDEAEETACPCCGKQLKHSRYADEGRFVESGVSCKCGYASGTSYGQNYLELPEGWKENDQGEIVNEEDETLLKEEEGNG